MSDYYNKYDDLQPIKFDNKDNKPTGNRWQSKIVWTSTFSLLLIILGTLGLYEKIGVTEDKLKTVIDSILSILVVLGILNNPSKEEF